MKTRSFVWLQISLAVIAVITSAVAAFVVSPSLHKAKQAEVAQAANATRAETSLAAVASSSLQRIQSLDAQSRQLSGGEVPELYLWRGGLRRSVLSRDEITRLVPLLKERRFLMGDSGPLLDYSPSLKSYVCEHFWFVIATSPGTVEATQRTLRELQERDSRYATAETLDSGPNNPNNGIAIGFFTSRADALALTREIGVPSFEAKPWGFGSNQSTCSFK